MDKFDEIDKKYRQAMNDYATREEEIHQQRRQIDIEFRKAWIAVCIMLFFVFLVIASL